MKHKREQKNDSADCPDSSSSAIKRSLIFLLKLTFSLGLIYVLFRSIDTAKMKEILLQADSFYMLHAMTAYAAAAVVSAVTWKILLIPLGLKISFYNAVKYRFISFFINNTLPSGVAGDAWRAYSFGKEAENTGRSFASVIVDKWVSYVALAGFALLSLFFGAEKFKELDLFKPLAVFVLFLTISIAVSILILPWLIKKGKNFFARYGINNPYTEGFDSLEIYRKKPLWILGACLLTVFSPLLGVGAYYYISLALNAPLPFLSFFMLVPVVRVINHIPISINAIGTQDISIVFFCQKFGMSMETAFSVSLLSHLLKTSITGIGGIWLLIIYLKQGGFKNILNGKNDKKNLLSNNNNTKKLIGR